MARNKFDQDETLETPFSFSHLKRAGKYIKRHARRMITALTLSALAAITALLGPKIIQYALDNTIPDKNVPQLILLSAVLLVTIIISVAFTTIRSRLMTRVGQDVVYDIRKDLFDHLQELSFEYYDDRPHGKILTRIVHYVNNLSDTLSNGIINFVLEIFNILFISIFMLATSPKLSLLVFAGVPVFLLVVILIKPAQRRSWQQVSNKSITLV